MATDDRSRRRRSLVRRLALWMSISAAVSFLAFAAIAYTVTILQEAADADESPEQITIEVRTEVLTAMMVAAPIGLLLATFGAIFLSRHALGPLRSVVQSATAITTRNLHERLPVPQTDDEVREAVLALNSLLDRLELGFGALGRFSAEASHELRTPLAVVAAELEVMLRRPRSAEEWENSARTCLDEARYLSRLVEALLELARAEGQSRPPEAVDIDAVIGRVLGALQAHARERGVRLAAAGENGEQTHASGHADAIESALRNVVDNAIRYTPADGEVVVSCSRSGAERLLIDVDDSGSGVEPHDAERIFDPFFRGKAQREASADDPSSGAGLGLTIARKLLETHAAHIEVQRSDRGGARFRISLPVFRKS